MRKINSSHALAISDSLVDWVESSLSSSLKLIGGSLLFPSPVVLFRTSCDYFLEFIESELTI